MSLEHPAVLESKEVLSKWWERYRKDAEVSLKEVSRNHLSIKFNNDSKQIMICYYIIISIQQIIQRNRKLGVHSDISKWIHLKFDKEQDIYIILVCLHRKASIPKEKQELQRERSLADTTFKWSDWTWRMTGPLASCSERENSVWHPWQRRMTWIKSQESNRQNQRHSTKWRWIFKSAKLVKSRKECVTIPDWKRLDN